MVRLVVVVVVSRYYVAALVALPTNPRRGFPMLQKDVRFLEELLL